MDMIKIDEGDPGCLKVGDCTGRASVALPVALVTLDAFRLHQKCKWDGAPLAQTYNAYEHDGGWSVAGYCHRLWLSLKCTKCGYDWSINHLGFPMEQ